MNNLSVIVQLEVFFGNQPCLAQAAWGMEAGCIVCAFLPRRRRSRLLDRWVQWTLAADVIDEARKAMGSRFTALMAESYKRAYLSMVTAQTLAEMEETIEFRKLEERSIATGQRPPLNRPDKEETRNRVFLTWRRRLVGNRFDADVHASITAVRSLVLGPTDEVDPTVTLSNLYRQAQRYKLSERVLLDPLAKLGANLNGPVFGFGLPESLSLGLPRVENVNAG